MPSNCSQPAMWQLVPDGAQMYLMVAGDHDRFIARARMVLVDDAGVQVGETILEDLALKQGITIPLQQFNYVVRLSVIFPGPEARADLAAEIRRPDGTRHGSPYECGATGKAGFIRRYTLIAVTNAELEVQS